MRRLLLAISWLLSIGLSVAHAEGKHTVVFEATVVRIDTWGLMKFTCGVAVNYRLVEYEVNAVQGGHLTPGHFIVAKHLACNWNELDELKPGDKVLVVAEILGHPEKGYWHPTLDQQAADLTKNARPDETVTIPLKSEPVLVQCRAFKVAELIYPTSQ